MSGLCFLWAICFLLSLGGIGVCERGFKGKISVR